MRLPAFLIFRNGQKNGTFEIKIRVALKKNFFFLFDNISKFKTKPLKKYSEKIDSPATFKKQKKVDSIQL